MFFFPVPTKSSWSCKFKLCLRHRLFFGFCASLQLAYIADARADAEDTFNATVGYSIKSDNNLFRLPDTTQNILDPYKKNELIGVATAGFSLDKSYSLQRFHLAGSVLDYKYQKFSYLSFAALNYDASWAWNLSKGLRGVLSTSRVQTPTSYQDFKGVNTRNVQTDVVTRWEAEGNLGGAWRALGSFDHISSQQEVAVVREGDSEWQGRALGMRYVFPSGTTASYRSRYGTGNSLGLTSTFLVEPYPFKDRLHEIELSWLFSVKTKLTARLGHLERKFAEASQRNYSGTTAALDVQWSVSEKVTLNASVRKELQPYLTITSNYIATDRLVLAPVWKATSKVSVLASYDIASRDFTGVAPGMLMTQGRRDIYRVASIGLQWQALPSTLVKLSMQNIHNSSNISGATYDSFGGTLAAHFNF